MLSTSDKLMGCTEVGLVEFSGGLEKASPLSFQSDWKAGQYLRDMAHAQNEEVGRAVEAGGRC